MQEQDINQIISFINVVKELYNPFIRKVPFSKMLLFSTLLYSSGNVGIIIIDNKKVIQKYSIYTSTEGNVVKSGIEDDINLYYTLPLYVVREVVSKKDIYLDKPWKLLKYTLLMLRCVSFNNNSFSTTFIKGSKTKLRVASENDIPYLVEWYNDKELNKLAGWTNSKISADKLRYSYSKSFGSDPMNLVIDNDVGKVIGTIQLYDFSDVDKSCKLGIRIGDKTQWGKSYGADSINAIAKYAFSTMDINRISLQVYEFNERATNCYIKCGFKYEGKTRKSAYIDGEFYDEILMGLLKSDYYGREK